MRLEGFVFLSVDAADGRHVDHWSYRAELIVPDGFTGDGGDATVRIARPEHFGRRPPDPLDADDVRRALKALWLPVRAEVDEAEMRRWETMHGLDAASAPIDEETKVDDADPDPSRPARTGTAAAPRVLAAD